MRATSTLAVTAGLIGNALGDFWVYNGIQYITVDPTVVRGFLFSGGQVDCDTVYNSISYSPTDDASGGGVRCVGCSTPEDDAVAVSDFEFNIEEFGHYTYYSYRAGELVDTNDNVVGSCVNDNSDNYNCFDGLATYKGQSQIFCTTNLAIP